jgi:hypothetical protein
MKTYDEAYVTVLCDKILDQHDEITHLKSLLESFWTGDVPQNATLDHMKLAKYGRQRLAEIGKTPALLVR